LLRAQAQPFYFEGMNAFLLSRYEDVDSAARNSSMVRSLDAFMSADYIAEQQRLANFHDMPNHEQFVQFSMLEQDGEAHRRLRMLVLREFSRTLIERHREMIQQYVDKLLDDLIERGEMDFVADFAAHVPGHVIGSLLGVPDEDCPQLRIWSEDIVQYFDADRTEDRKQLAERATTEFSEYLVALIAERSKQPRDDLLSTLVRARDAGEMNESELISLAMLILAGGHGSTIDVLGNGMYALLKNPEQLAKLRSNPALIHSAVQEMFRFDSPLPFFHRFASKDVEVMGKTYPRGTRFGLLYGSANRDQMQFPDADRFDISRNPNRHVAFGRGAHLCLGNNLARLDMEIVFLTLLRRIQSIELTSDEVVYKPGSSARGIRQLPLRVMA
jgi:cytochrome P450